LLSKTRIDPHIPVVVQQRLALNARFISLGDL
jgi:hypothetical protein